ncbi:MAG: hypothetical protein M1831_003011 [Alyxoria varia]|nr:MAG: hypothetical protein M1831_003011 [Alyxoria varia]
MSSASIDRPRRMTPDHIASMASSLRRKSQSRHRGKSNPNDVPVKPASTEVISNLLSSFSSITPDKKSSRRPTIRIDERNEDMDGRNDTHIIPPPPLPPPSPAPPPSLESPKRLPRQKQLTPRMSATNLRDGQQLSNLPPPEENNQDDQASSLVDDAAEPPVIRTARRPSGLSKITALKQEPRHKRSKDSSQRGVSLPTTPSRSPSLTPADPYPTQPATIQSEASWRHRAFGYPRSSVDSRTTSMNNSTQPEGTISSMPTRQSKGKEKAPAAGPADTPTIRRRPRDITIPERNRGIKSEQRSQNPYSSAHIYFPQSHSTPLEQKPFPVEEDDEDLDLNIPGPSKSPRHAASAEDFKRARKRFGRIRESGLVEEQDFIPTRRSSLRHSASSPWDIPSRRSSWRVSPFTSTKQSVVEPEITESIEDTEIQEQAPRSGSVPAKGGDQISLDEDTEVMKRIKQLREAKEQREKESFPPNVTDRRKRDRLRLTRKYVRDSIPAQPDTTRAGRQIAEAGEILEHKVDVTPDDASEEYVTGLSSRDALKISYPARTGDNDLQSRQRYAPDPHYQHQHQPPKPSRNVSRSSSKSKRWSHPDLSPRGEDINNRDISRNRNSILSGSHYPPPVFEEAQQQQQQQSPQPNRPSIDSVEESVYDFLKLPRLSQKIRAADDERRIISFSEVGDLSGFPVFCCVGMGLTRYIMAFYEELAISLRLRLITPERPGIGESSVWDEQKTPLHWSDDILTIATHLSIGKFSLLAHSAGAIYALATALKLPSRIRGRIHLLATWIPPSQMTASAVSSSGDVVSSSSSPNIGSLPRSQRFLRMVPTPFLKLTNASFMGNVVTRASPRSPPNGATARSRKSVEGGASGTVSSANSPRPSFGGARLASVAAARNANARKASAAETSTKSESSPTLDNIITFPSDHSMASDVLSAGHYHTPGANTPTKIGQGATTPRPTTPKQSGTAQSPAERQGRYDAMLTPLLWDLATRGANPAQDLIVCLERNRDIGFRYVDVIADRGFVVHHGGRDARVPIENVRAMVSAGQSATAGTHSTVGLRNAELRVLEGEGHGLMANAGVMAGVLGEMASEWETLSVRKRRNGGGRRGL